jgi:hypothetical protein
MTDEQINQAIAEACGIVGKDKYGPLYQTPDGWVVDCPQFATDLNAMHEAEKVILPKFSHFYANKLALITGVDCSDETAFFCATARQRAEAFLRTLGKWEATTEESSADGKDAE